jgi:cytidine deaminase
MKKLIISLLILFTASSCARQAVTAMIPTEMQETNYQSISDDYKKLVDAAEAVLANSYNPYSKFFVGAAVLAEDGTIISGTNFENAAYGSTICAERAAILRANAMGYRKLKAIAIIGRGQDFEMPEVISPCGSCRQVIYEVSELSMQAMDVLMSNTAKDKIVISSINQLLPMAFGPKDLGVDLEKY